MTRTTTSALIATVAVTVAATLGYLAATSQDNDSPAAAKPDTTVTTRDCAAVFAPGRPVADVVADTHEAPCMNDDTILLATVVSWECPDGTSVHQVQDHGWGRDGQTWQAADVPAPYADCVLPGTDAQHP